MNDCSLHTVDFQNGFLYIRATKFFHMANKNFSILVVDDEEAVRYMLSSLIRSDGYAVETATDGVSAINALQTKLFHIVLSDVKMPKVDGVELLKFAKNNFPSVEVIMLTGVGDVKIAVECMKLGAYDYITKPSSSDELLTTIGRALERRRLIIDNTVLKNQLEHLQGPLQMVGNSEAFHKVLELAAKVAPTESTVLIQGPSGTGKELIAHYIYQQSERKTEPFVTLNCASIPETLIESELFGHEKGSFTDAKTSKPGIVEIANNGTLFLDEIGDISPLVQPKILRFIQSGEFRRVGGNTELNANCRILSATNKNLKDEVKAGRFREDLLYRLNVITIELPPLRQRKEDIPLLVTTFLSTKMKTKVKKGISQRALEVLMDYDWPGNIRELENVIERAAILCQDNTIEPRDLSLTTSPVLPPGTSDKVIGTALPMKEIEHMHIEGVLRSFRGNKTEAAKVLGISLKTLYTKIQQFQIKI
ncbi:MAG: Sigma-54-dependent Fis family transcriptional regulator [Bacteroidetes bacterium]|nr:Sigma-54-dependent Fis family transcriptional regulator [Bacteroidota bacterium]